MSNINVKEILGANAMKTEPARGPSAFDYPKWNAENAFRRLQLSRDVVKYLKEGINENAESMPLETRDLYDDIIQLLKKAERKEIATITYGE